MPSERAGSGALGFDRIAPVYDAWYATPLGRLVDRLEKSAVLALVEAEAAGTALDLSCGTGRYALALAERGLSVVGVDLSQPMLRIARSKAIAAGLKLPVVRADARTLPFRAGTFDLVTIILGLEFTVEPGRPLGEAWRVLKPRGRLVVAILNRTGLWTLWRRLKRRFAPSIWREAAFLGRADLAGLLRTQGFSDVRWGSAVHFLPLFGEKGIGWLERWETMGARWMPARAAFLVAAARRS